MTITEITGIAQTVIALLTTVFTGLSMAFTAYFYSKLVKNDKERRERERLQDERAHEIEIRVATKHRIAAINRVQRPVVIKAVADLRRIFPDGAPLIIDEYDQIWRFSDRSQMITPHDLLNGLHEIEDERPHWPSSGDWAKTHPST